MNTLTLDNFIGQAATLPPAPRVLINLLELLEKNDTDSARVVELISYDPVLTGKVLQRCNSAACGLKEPVRHLPEAVGHLGFNEIYRLVAVIISRSTLDAAQRGYGMVAGELWRHSVVTAVSSKIVARTLGEDENVAFTAGLLHDIGKLVLGPRVAKIYPEIAAMIEASGKSFVEAELTAVGVEHAAVGGRLLEQWGLPECLVRAVWHHHDPAQARPFVQLAACVYLADMIAHLLGHGHGFQANAVRGRGEVLEFFEISPREIENFLIETDSALKAANWFSTTTP